MTFENVRQHKLRFYSGDERENAEQFLIDFDYYWMAEGISPEAKLNTIRSCLVGEALAWFQENELDFCGSWEVFEYQFLLRFGANRSCAFWT